MKDIVFVSGLPRSGSTLLMNILAQNPSFHSSSTSGILDIMFGLRNNWDNLIEFKASPNQQGLKRVLRGVLESYYEPYKDKVIFDKSRGWCAYIEMAQDVLDSKPKILVPVRDVREILSSLELLWRKHASSGQFSQERDFYYDWQTVNGRVKIWLNSSQLLGIAYNRVKDALKRGHSEHMLFVDFDDLTRYPERTMQKVYTFIGQDYYPHDYNNIVQVTHENDNVYHIPNLHSIRQKVEPINSRWESVLGREFEHLSKLNYWRN